MDYEVFRITFTTAIDGVTRTDLVSAKHRSQATFFLGMRAERGYYTDGKMTKVKIEKCEHKHKGEQNG